MAHLTFNINCHVYQRGSNVPHKDVSIAVMCLISFHAINLYIFHSVVPVHGIFAKNGIFIWWQKITHINVTAYLIQFKSEETTTFASVIGTTRTIDEFETWNDVYDDLISIPATTNIHPNDQNDAPKSPSNGNKTISIVELRVDGNVSGILIPNKHEIEVRILMRIIDDDGELIQDMKYVEWKKVCRNLTRTFGFFLVIFRGF